MKKQRLNNSTEAYYGFEKDHISPNLSPTKVEVMHALNYFNKIDGKVKKSYAIKYAKTVGVVGIETLSDAYCASLGATARMLQVGFMIDLDWAEKATRYISEHGVPKVKAVPKVVVKSPNDPIAVTEAWDFIDEQIDRIVRGEQMIPQRMFNLNAAQSAEIRRYILGTIAELSDDDQFKACYGFGVSKRRKILKFLTENNEIMKPTIKARKVRPKSPQTVIKDLKYRMESQVLGVKSINPVRLLGKQRLVVFNEKNRSIGIYVANSSAGFSMRGSSLTGFDPVLSVGKKDSKPRQNTLKISQMSKTAGAKVFQQMTTKESVLTGRLNVDTVILAVF